MPRHHPRPAEEDAAAEEELKRRLLTAVWALGACIALGQQQIARQALSDAGLSTADVAATLAAWAWWGMLAPLVVRLVRAVPVTGDDWGEPMAAHFALAAFLALAHAVATTATVRVVVRATIDGGILRALSRTLPDAIPTGIAVYGCLALVAHAVQVTRDSHARALRTADLQAELARLRLQGLQAQLQPHFLFNAIHNISSLVTRDPTTARRMMTRLGQLLRRALAASQTEWATVRDEIEVVRCYLDLQRLRFGDQLRYTVEVAPGTASGMMPPLLLQPLVENAVLHGVERAARGAHVHVRVWREGDTLHAEVHDDGAAGGDTGADTRRRRGRTGGLGLTNTALRLANAYGSAGQLVTGPLAAGGYRAAIQCPWLDAVEDPTAAAR